MLDELRAVLNREGITTAAIIDDVYDDVPTPHDVDEESWNFFGEDYTDEDVAIIREGYGISDPEDRWSELRSDRSFIKFLWERKEDSERFQALFRSFTQRQQNGKAQLEPLRVLLFDELELEGGTYGTDSPHAVDAQLLFLDLFLGAKQDEAARNRALERVKAIVAPRRESPPLLVLMSSSTRLHGLRDEFRDEAELMGCQFRTLQKASLDDLPEVYELLYRLTGSYRNSLLLSTFLELWHQALRDATTRFLKTVRRLDLRDYADLQTLVLNADDELIGAYLLEIFGKYFQFELEEDARLSAAALRLNSVEWNSYPVPHFLPASVSANIADGVLFRSSKLLAKGELQFGDVLFSTRVDALGEGIEPSANFANGERIALVCLTAACDLQHGYAKRFFFIAGVARPSELLLHKRPTALLTPILIHEDKTYVIEWDVGAPVAWSLNDIEKHLNLETPSFEIVRRFRSLFSLQLQQVFASSLTRVGTPVMPPMQHVTAVTISYRDMDGLLHVLVSATAAERRAVVLVGRDEQKLVDRLALDSELISELRVRMQGVDTNTLAAGKRQQWTNAVASWEIFIQLEQGLVYSRDGWKRSFKGTDYDILLIVGPYVEEGRSPISAQRTVQDQALGPLVIELSMEPS